MSINHFVDPNINPKLDAYCKDAYIDNFSVDTLVADNIDVSNNTTFTTANSGTNSIGEFLVELDDTQISGNYIGEEVNSNMLKVNNLMTAPIINNTFGIYSENNINLKGRPSIIPTYISGNSGDFSNCNFDQGTIYDSDWLFTRSNIEKTFDQTISPAELKNVKRIRLNIVCTTNGFYAPTGYFSFTLLDSEVTTSSKIYSCYGTASVISTGGAGTLSIPPLRFLCGLSSPVPVTTPGTGRIEVKYGGISSLIFGPNQPIMFQLDMEYSV